MAVNGCFETQCFEPASATEVEIPSEPIVQNQHHRYNLRSGSGKPRKCYGPQISTPKDSRGHRATTKLQYRKALSDDEVQIQGVWPLPDMPNHGTIKADRELEDGTVSPDITNDWEDASSIFEPGREPNMEKITSDEIGNTSFAAKLTHVQYGTYEGEPAALLKFNIHFGFFREGRTRITAASVRFTFEQSVGLTRKLPKPRNPNNDPIIKRFTPVRLQGPMKSGETESKMSISNPFELKLFNTQILKFGYANPLAARTVKYKQEGRLDLKGMTNSSSKHKNGDNAVVWHLSENAIAANGIVPDFPAAVVILLPRDPRHNIRVTGFIEIWLGFTLNPRDGGNLHKRETNLCCWTRGRPKGSQLRQVCIDFADPEFPWDTIVKIPPELKRVDADDTETG